jgi:hypothetical protein
MARPPGAMARPPGVWLDWPSVRVVSTGSTTRGPWLDHRGSGSIGRPCEWSRRARPPGGRARPAVRALDATTPTTRFPGPLAAAPSRESGAARTSGRGWPGSGGRARNERAGVPARPSGRSPANVRQWSRQARPPGDKLDHPGTGSTTRGRARPPGASSGLDGLDQPGASSTTRVTGSTGGVTAGGHRGRRGRSRRRRRPTGPGRAGRVS